MSDVIHLDHFRRGSAREHTPSQTRVIRAMEGMSQGDRQAFAEHVEKLHPVLAARPERERRKKLWRKAETLYRFYDGLCDLAGDAGRAFEDYGLHEAKPLAHYHDMDHWLPLTDRRRDAAQNLLLTPAPSMADLNVKRRMRSQSHHGVDHALAAKIDTLIAADDAWLLANAGHRSRRRK
jgi:hypothetical protein